MLPLNLFDFAGSGMSIGLPGPPGPPGTPGISYSDLTAYLRSKPTSSVLSHGPYAPQDHFTGSGTDFSLLPIRTNNPLQDSDGPSALVSSTAAHPMALPGPVQTMRNCGQFTVLLWRAVAVRCSLGDGSGEALCLLQALQHKGNCYAI